MKEDTKVGVSTISVSVENLDELKELLQKASNQLEQLEKTLEQINNFQFDIKRN